MLIEVEYRASVLLSFNSSSEVLVYQIKELISKNTLVSPICQALTTLNGELLEDADRLSEYSSAESCRLMLFLRKGERPLIKLEVDIAQGQRLTIGVQEYLTVAVLKMRINHALEDDHIGSEQLLVFGPYILEDDRTLQDYGIKDGSLITVLRFLFDRKTSTVLQYQRSRQQPTESNHVSNLEEPIQLLEMNSDFPRFPERRTNDPRTSMPQAQSSAATTVFPMATEETFASGFAPAALQEPQSFNFQTQKDDSLPKSTPSPQNEPLSPNRFAPASPKQFAPQPRYETDLASRQNTLRPSLSTATEPMTITIPGGLLSNNRRKSFTSKRFESIEPIAEPTNRENMCVIFTDCNRKIPLELPADTTVSRAIESLKQKLSGQGWDKIVLFRGIIQMDEHRQLRSYGIIHGTPVVFKNVNRTMPQ